MGSKAKLIFGIVLFVAILAITGYIIIDEISGNMVASEDSISLTEDKANNNYYMSSLNVSEYILKNENIPTDISQIQFSQEFLTPISDIISETEAESVKETEEKETVKETETKKQDNKTNKKDKTNTNTKEETTKEETTIEETTESIETEPATEAEATETSEPAYFDPFNSLFIVNNEIVTEYLNIREVPGGTVVGVLYPGHGGTVVSCENGWAYVISGDVSGYVDMNYIITGTTAVEVSNAEVMAVVTAPTLSLRKKPNAKAEIMDILTQGNSYRVYSVENGWANINNADMFGYVSADFVEFKLNIPVAVPMTVDFWNGIMGTEAVVEEEAAQPTVQVTETPVTEAPVVETTAAPTVPVTEAPVVETTPAPTEAPVTEATVVETVSVEETSTEIIISETVVESSAETETAHEMSADEQIAQRIAAYANSGQANRGAHYLSASDIYLMACILMIEDGYGTLEGQLAVANVLINRLDMNYWGNTMTSVVYAPNQFWGTDNGYLDGIMASGPNESCVEAALMACAGINNIGDYIFFCSHRSANYAAYKSYVNIDGNIFYKK